MNVNMIIGLVAQTDIHAGASNSEAAVDLPIQREGHTDWPVIAGSGVKGALRSFGEDNLPPEKVNAIFGPDTNNASEHAGALLVSDARLALLPVRSLTSHVKWVTCPALIQRLANDVKRMNLKKEVDLNDYANLDDEHALAFRGQNAVYLEEYRYSLIKQDLSKEITLLEMITDGENKSDFNRALRDNLVIVSNDQFRHLCRNAIPLQTHIAIDSETKTVKNSALFVEENLPSETVMYVCTSCADSRKPGGNHSADVLMADLKEVLSKKKYLQIGGNLTTGMGWFEVSCKEG